MKILFSIAILLLSSCALIERSQQARNENAGVRSSSDRFSANPQQKPKVIVKRTYIDANKDPGNNSRYSEEITRYAYELGFDPQNTLSAVQMKAVEDRKKVRELERRLDSKKEREQYSKVLPLLTDSEKVEYLSIPSTEGRQSWTNKNNVASRVKAPTSGMRDAMESQDITLQMPMDYVKKAWGEPSSIDVSGNPLYKNERWKYLRYVSTPDGYRAEKRFVYFESGKVVGWETE